MHLSEIDQAVENALQNQAITDMHTHCFSPAFGESTEPTGLLQWGIDELLTYHYLIAELYRIVPVTGRGALLPHEDFWKMSKTQQANLIWRHLFVERIPMSEACRGVLTTLRMLDLDPNEKTLDGYRRWNAQQTCHDFIDQVMQIANVDSITMTNSVFDEQERRIWLNKGGVARDPRFEAVLRIDLLLCDWPTAAAKLNEWGFDARSDFSANTANEVRRFLNDWLDRMQAIYVATSLDPDFRYPDPNNPQPGRFIDECLMPVCAERGLPWALMMGAKRQVNPVLRDAGDSLGRADIASVVNLCQRFAHNKFMVTMLSRENQHELCATARKFGNLLIFGCWWFINNPSLIEEVTRMRLELLGTTFVAQHSDARVIDQLVYKWEHSRQVIGKVLVDKYKDLHHTGWHLTTQHIKQDVELLFRDNFRKFLSR